jgi:exodeoxyribonuclease V alpha subunit
MQRGPVGCQNLNALLQQTLNPHGPSVQRYGWTYRLGDKVMQTVNNYDKEVFNGDIGRIAGVDDGEQEITVRFADRGVRYDFNELDELIPAYATTVHKAQGSEYPAVVAPIHTQHYPLLQRNLLYTAITRAQKLCVLIGSKRAVNIAVNRMESRRRVTLLKQRLMELSPAATE